VWSFGITLIELAMGRFPFSSEDSDDEYDSEDEHTLSPVRPGGKDQLLADADARKASRKANKKDKNGVSLGGSGSQMSILELLQHVVNEPAPRLKPEGKYKKEAEIFVDSCLMKDVDRRPTPKELLVSAEHEESVPCTVLMRL
jgi:mitogen-activated protein kinase kinase